MKRISDKILPFLFVVLIILVSVFKADAQPYIKTFLIVRTVSVSNVSELNAAISAAQTGDVILLADGNYPGNLILNKPNVMVRCNGHCTVTGNIKLQATNTWLWGVEVTNNVSGSFIDMAAADTFVINCVVKGQSVNGSVGISAFAQSGLRVIYGTTVVNTQHLMYLQNTAPHLLYVVNNTLIEPLGEPNNQRAIHLYTESANKGENVKLIRNIVRDGEALIGGQVNATPFIDNVVQEGIHYKAQINLGYKRPTDTDVIDTLLFRSPLKDEWFWGAGEVVYAPSLIFRTGNTFFNSKFTLRTSAYTPGRIECIPKLRATDVVDNNKYYGGFDNALCADNKNDVTLAPLSLWQTKTLAAGNKLDANSTVSPNAPADGYKLIVNEYDNSRATLAVWNFSGSPTVSLSLPQSAALYSAKAPYGAPITTLPQGASQLSQATEFEAYHVKFGGIPPPPEVCGNGNCVPPENTTSCPADCPPPAPVCPDILTELRAIRLACGEKGMRCVTKMTRTKQQLDALILLYEDCR